MESRCPVAGDEIDPPARRAQAARTLAAREPPPFDPKAYRAHSGYPGRPGL